MKKTLLYYLYVKDIISDNKNYEIHKECLKHYKNVFDELIFYIGVEDLNNKLIIQDTISWINEICGEKKCDIKVRKCTPLCESEFFKKEIIENMNIHKDKLIFISHSKNVSRLDKNLSLIAKAGENGSDVIPLSIIRWVIAAYFYSLNFNDEVSKRLLGCPLPSELFYGSLLTYPIEYLYNSKFSMNKGGCLYQGTFYWINMNKFINLLNKYPNILPEISDRFFFEDLPGMIASGYNYGDGCTSHNDVSITDEFNLYKELDEGWNILINILGDYNEFWEFYNKIMNKINFE